MPDPTTGPSGIAKFFFGLAIFYGGLFSATFFVILLAVAAAWIGPTGFIFGEKGILDTEWHHQTIQNASKDQYPDEWSPVRPYLCKSNVWPKDLETDPLPYYHCSFQDLSNEKIFETVVMVTILIAAPFFFILAWPFALMTNGLAIAMGILWSMRKRKRVIQSP